VHKRRAFLRRQHVLGEEAGAGEGVPGTHEARGGETRVSLRAFQAFL
jgi:hypothetical protein